MHAERLRVSRPDDLPLEAVIADEMPLDGRAAALVSFVDAVHNGRPDRIDAARRAVQDAADEPTMIDAAGVIAVFHGLNRVADATGCGLGADTAATAGVREYLNLDRYAPTRT